MSKFTGRRVVLFGSAFIFGITTWGVVAGVAAAPILSAAGSPTTTIALSDTTTTTIKPTTTTTRPTSTTIEQTTTTTRPTSTTIEKTTTTLKQTTTTLKQTTTTVKQTTTTVKQTTTTVKKTNGSLNTIAKLPIKVVCAIGDTGPGGGIVFYDAGSHQSWGRCLEAAPNTWNGGTSDAFAYWGCQGINVPGAHGTAIGTGQANTTAIVNACATSAIAARLADNLVFGGKSDWFLPSKEELMLMNTERTIIGGLNWFDWSSTEIDANHAFLLWMGPGTLFSTFKGNLSSSGTSPSNQVRPIRAFG